MKNVWSFSEEVETGRVGQGDNVVAVIVAELGVERGVEMDQGAGAASRLL